jgi:hypothetical protein
MMTIMEKAPAARKTKPYRLILLIFCLTLGASLFSGSVSADSTYYAIYCTGDKKNLTIKGDNHALLDCGGQGGPAVQTKVKSLSSNPDGAHAVTIVEADCYPDAPSGSIEDGRILCSNGPPATLTLGKHFAANKKKAAAAKKKPGKGSSKPSKKPSKKPPKKKPGSISTNQSPIKSGNLPTSQANSNTIKTILQIVFGIIGAFALLSMTASGLKYVTSAGDPGKTSEAKKGIIFALMGLMIAVTAEAIVAFVIHWGAP